MPERKKSPPRAFEDRPRFERILSVSNGCRTRLNKLSPHDQLEVLAELTKEVRRKVDAAGCSPSVVDFELTEEQ